MVLILRFSLRFWSVLGLGCGFGLCFGVWCVVLDFVVWFGLSWVGLGWVWFGLVWFVVRVVWLGFMVWSVALVCTGVVLCFWLVVQLVCTSTFELIQLVCTSILS